MNDHGGVGVARDTGVHSTMMMGGEEAGKGQHKSLGSRPLVRCTMARHPSQPMA